MKKLSKNSHKFWVSFEILTKSISLEELSKKIRIDASEGSKNKSEQIRFGKKEKFAKETWLRLFSVLPETEKLEEHLNSIIERVGKSRVFKNGILPKDSRLSICIAETHDFMNSVYCQINISEKYVIWCGKHNVSLEVVVYPLGYVPN